MRSGSGAKRVPGGLYVPGSAAATALAGGDAKYTGCDGLAPTAAITLRVGVTKAVTEKRPRWVQARSAASRAVRDVTSADAVSDAAAESC